MSAKGDVGEHTEQDGAHRRGGQEARSARTRQAIYEAAVQALDEYGFAETSVLKVQSLAGVSRGALTHQYPTKEDLIVAVAEQLLDEVRHSPSPKTGPRPVGEDGYLEWLLWFAWSRFVDTPKGRALCEIFQAMRTDSSLSERLSAPVEAWQAEIESWFLRRLSAEGGDAEVLDFVRVFNLAGRGMMIGGFTSDLDERKTLMRAMASLATPRIRRRSEAERYEAAAMGGSDTRQAAGAPKRAAGG